MAAARAPCFAGLLLVLACSGANAHRGHAVWTDITWAGDRFEIVHRMHVADAISINSYMGGTRPIEDLHSLALVALYVEERFALVGAGDGPAPKLLGAEIEGDILFVYQEWETALPAVFPRIDNRILLDVEPGAEAFTRISGPGLREERQRPPRAP